MLAIRSFLGGCDEIGHIGSALGLYDAQVEHTDTPLARLETHLGDGKTNAHVAAQARWHPLLLLLFGSKVYDGGQTNSKAAKNAVHDTPTAATAQLVDENKVVERIVLLRLDAAGYWQITGILSQPAVRTSRDSGENACFGNVSVCFGRNRSSLVPFKCVRSEVCIRIPAHEL